MGHRSGIKNQGYKQDIDVFVVRLGTDENGETVYRESRPCHYCVQILQQYGIRRVYYTLSSPDGSLKFGVEKVSDMNGYQPKYITKIISNTNHK